MSLSEEIGIKSIPVEVNYLYDKLSPYYSNSTLQLVNKDTFINKLKSVHTYMTIMYETDTPWFSEVELALALSISELSRISGKYNYHLYPKESIYTIKNNPELLSIFEDSNLIPQNINNVFYALSHFVGFRSKDPLRDDYIFTRIIKEIDMFGQHAYLDTTTFIDKYTSDILATDNKLANMNIDDDSKKYIIIRRYLSNMKINGLSILRRDKFFSNRFDNLYNDLYEYIH